MPMQVANTNGVERILVKQNNWNTNICLIIIKEPSNTETSCLFYIYATCFELVNIHYLHPSE